MHNPKALLQWHSPSGLCLAASCQFSLREQATAGNPRHLVRVWELGSLEPCAGGRPQEHIIPHQPEAEPSS